MFKDMMSHTADETTLKFLKTEQARFLAGEKVSGLLWRHPMMRLQSLIPAQFQLLEGASGERAYYRRVSINVGGKLYDVSGAFGMKLDTDFDTAHFALVSNERTKNALQQAMADPTYRREFVENVMVQQDLMRKVKETAKSTTAEAVSRLDRAVTGARNLSAVKFETGAISNLVAELRVAAAARTDRNDFINLSLLLSEIEEAPISSKLGLSPKELRASLESFARGEGGADVFNEVWRSVYGSEESFQAGGRTFSRDIQGKKLIEAVRDAQPEIQEFRDITRTGAQSIAGKGKHINWRDTTTDEVFAELLSKNQAGRGDSVSLLTRSMRMGPGSALPLSRSITSTAFDMWEAAKAGLVKRWQYPAMAVGAAVGLGLLTGGDGLKVKDHGHNATNLGHGSLSPGVTPPNLASNRIVTGGGGIAPMGYEVNARGNFGEAQVMRLGNYGVESGTNVRITDNRGAITPQYIDKAQRERYH